MEMNMSNTQELREKLDRYRDVLAERVIAQRHEIAELKLKHRQENDELRRAIEVARVQLHRAERAPVHYAPVTSQVSEAEHERAQNELIRSLMQQREMERAGSVDDEGYAIWQEPEECIVKNWNAKPQPNVPEGYILRSDAHWYPNVPRLTERYTASGVHEVYVGGTWVRA
jgi:hypothetical protein